VADIRRISVPFVTKENAKQIAELNVQFRQTFKGGKIVCSESVKALPTTERIKLFSAIKAFSKFNEENDPYQERNFGSVTLNGERYFFMIDYFTLDLKSYSKNAADPSITKRIMTIVADKEFHR